MAIDSSGISSRFISFDNTDGLPTLSNPMATDPWASPKPRLVNTISGSEAQSSWYSLFTFTNRYQSLTICMGLGATILAALTKPTATIFLGQVFGILTSFGSGDIGSARLLEGVAKWCAALAVLGGIAWVVEGIFLGSWMIFGELQAQTAREQLFRGMLHEEIAWFDLRANGVVSLMVRIETQIRELQLCISQPIGFFVYEIVSAFAAIGIAFYFSWQLSLVVLATFPLVIFVLYLVSKRLGAAVGAQKEQLSQASKLVNSCVSGINTVKSFNGQSQEVWQYMKVMQLATRYYMIQARVSALQFAIIKFVMVGIFVQGFWFGLYLLNHHGANPAHIVTTFYACVTAIQAIEVILPQWLVLAKGISAGSALKAILCEIREGTTKPNTSDLLFPKRWDGDIEVRDVTFSYPTNPRQTALDKSSFFFPAGETTFIVGLSGSGKSTLGSLLMKYYDSVSGEIFLDGTSLKTLDTHCLRQNVTFIEQDSTLFNETVLQNIAFGRQDYVSRSDVLNACRTSQLEPTLSNLPDGIDTSLGPGGISLSGGQQQRVTIARARLRDAPILILDEVTSALDPTSRTKVVQAIREWRKGRTTIFITHDVSQILDEEYLYVLDRGRVIQEGFRRDLAGEQMGSFAILLSGACKSDFDRSPQIPRRMSTSTQSQRSSTSSEESPVSPDWTEIAPRRRGQAADFLLMRGTRPNSFAGDFLDLRGDIAVTLGAGATRASLLWTDQLKNTPDLKSDPKFKPCESPSIGPFRPDPSFNAQQLGPSHAPSCPPQSLKQRRHLDSAIPASILQEASEKSVTLNHESQFSEPEGLRTESTPSYSRMTLDATVEAFVSMQRLKSPNNVTSITLDPMLSTISESTMDAHKLSSLSSRVPIERPTANDGTEVKNILSEEIHHGCLDPHKDKSLKPVPLTKVFGTIWPNLTWPNRIKLIIAFSFAFVVSVATPAFGYILAKLLAVYYAPFQDRSHQAIIWASALLAVAVIDGLSTYVYHWLLEYCGHAWISTLRVEAMKRILAQPRAWFDKEKNSPDKLAECLDRNAEEMRNLLGRFAGPIFVTWWMLVISIAWALIINWKLSLVALSTAPFMYAGSRIFNYVTTVYEDKCNQAAQQTSSILTETFNNIKVVRSLTLEDYFKRKYLEATKNTYKVGRSRGIYSGITFGFADSLSLLIVSLLFYYGTKLISEGRMNTGAVLQVFNLLLFGLSNALATLALLPQINSSRATATQMLLLASLPYKASHESTGTKRLRSPFPIVLDKMCFSYPNNPNHRRALTNVSFTIRPGSCTAIVGGSGSGKSTIASLLLGLYPPNNGLPGAAPPLTFAGTSIVDLNITSLRNSISIVSQQTQIFPGTIYANIAYGLPEGSPYANLICVTRAAEQAGMDEFISSLAQGYNTVIGDGGQGLSGGQMQRIAIARALVRQPRILILDEATSALDSISAESIRNTVRRLHEASIHAAEDGIAVIIITHSVEMMNVADDIVVMEAGRVVEQGKFKGLRKKAGGKFADLIGMERLSDRYRRGIESRLR